MTMRFAGPPVLFLFGNTIVGRGCAKNRHDMYAHISGK